MDAARLIHRLTNVKGSRLGPALLVGLFVLMFLGGCNRAMTAEQLANDMETRLERVSTVQGLLDISMQGITLQQQLWVERPLRLRTETAAGPSAFRGVIVVLNEQDGWVYSPALTMATVVDRTHYDPTMAGASGSGSMLERIPVAVMRSLRADYPLNEIGRETLAGRRVRHIEIVVPANDPDFPSGPLHVWLDEQFGYPLGFRDSSARHVRFTSVAFNQEIDPVTFVFFPPPSAEVRRVDAPP